MSAAMVVVSGQFVHHVVNGWQELFLHYLDWLLMKQPLVNCPQCGKIIAGNPENLYRPFCSERCKMIDLGQWAAESYRIPDTEKGAENDQKEK